MSQPNKDYNCFDCSGLYDAKRACYDPASSTYDTTVCKQKVQASKDLAAWERIQFKEMLLRYLAHTGGSR